MVRLTPRGGADRIEGVVDGVLRARVAAPAVDGAANQALLRLLADALVVPRSDVGKPEPSSGGGVGMSAGSYIELYGWGALNGW